MLTDEAQMHERVQPTAEEGERNLPGADGGAEAGTAAVGQTKAQAPSLMERGGREKQHVAGVPEGGRQWRRCWPASTSRRRCVRWTFPSLSCGVRTLGIPTVVYRLIQQALLQVLQPVFEPGFSESSYGFRPERSAQQAVLQAQGYVPEGRRWVVDIDPEKFFDRVNHDILMSRVARQVKDARVLKLIRRYLEAGLMRGGVVEARKQGTPQGGPLSPLLSNILLTDSDRELGKRGLAFCRYADDCNIYVRSKVAGQRLLAGMVTFRAERLNLQVNEAKSACARPWARKFLGYSLTAHRQAKLRIAPESLQRLTGRVKELMRKGRGRSLAHTIAVLNPVPRGWIGYFQHTQSKRPLEELDGRIRRRLRCLLWRQAKSRATRTVMLRRQGLTEDRAWHSARNGQGQWWNAGARHMGAAFPKGYFDALGLTSLLDTQQRLQSRS